MAKLPTVTIIGEPMGKVIINEEDLPNWEAKGYKLFVEDGAEEVTPEPEITETKPEELGEYKLADLREFASAAGIDYRGKKKDELVSELKEAGFVPTEDTDI